MRLLYLCLTVFLAISVLVPQANLPSSDKGLLHPQVPFSCHDRLDQLLAGSNNSLCYSQFVSTFASECMKPFWKNSPYNKIVIFVVHMLCSTRFHLATIVSPLQQSSRMLCSVLRLYLHQSLICGHDVRALLLHTLRRLASSRYFELHPLLLLFVFYFGVKYACSRGIVHSSVNISCHESLMVERVSAVGGRPPYLFEPKLILSYVKAGQDISSDLDDYRQFSLKYIAHVNDITSTHYLDGNFVHANVPLDIIVPYIPVKSARDIARLHGIALGRQSQINKESLRKMFKTHCCTTCKSFWSVFAVQRAPDFKGKCSTVSQFVKKEERDEQKSFPPSPISKQSAHRIISNFCERLSPESFEEAGCSVCGELKPVSELSRLKNIKNLLHLLCAPGVTRVERKDESKGIREYSGPVLDYECKMVCSDCRQSLRKGKVPRFALAKGLWIGKVPEELRGLSWVECFLIARVRHNSCFVRVSSGHSKMVAHVVAFESPIQKIYSALPPPVAELDEVLAVLFTGPCMPKTDEFSRLQPLLVRRQKVAAALEWLKLNHADYADLSIAYQNLEEYPENTPPVAVHYKELATNKFPESTSKFDAESEDGVESGDVPFIVHGLTGQQIDNKSATTLKGIALRHWSEQGKVLMIGRDPNLVTIYRNPQLYPQMFPWLFPYGLGGIGLTNLSDISHKRHLLMYHDKRFQRDPNFVFIAFSHEQVKACSRSSFLAVDKKSFGDIADRILSVNPSTLDSLAQRMSKGEIVRPESEEEKKCFRLINDIDCVGGKVPGMISCKKDQRNEIWSLTYSKGAPLWYITLSPADSKHPLALYFAGKPVKFDSTVLTSDERWRLVASNPVGSARFFHFMISCFIKHVLGVGTTYPGLFGKTGAYYGTVEQQGRLTLHLHLLLWIEGSYSPDETRKRILDPKSDFCRRMINYLEQSHIGEFMTGTREEVMAHIEREKSTTGYIDPCETLPPPPPKYCKQRCESCTSCKTVETWWTYFKARVDHVLALSNIHTCSTTLKKDGTRDKRRQYLGCLDNVWGKCKARFPRPEFVESVADPITGALSIKKHEPWMNTVAPVITYLFGCNTDVTSLRSGTAIKGVLSYCTDYITKPGLKTFAIFEAVKTILDKNVAVMASSISRHEKARQLLTKLVNALGTKMELGSPMISMYLLGNPDHYTGDQFSTFYWSQFVQEVLSAWTPETEDSSNKPSYKVVILKKNSRVVGLSSVYDYKFRSAALEDMDLFTWISRCTRVKYRHKSTACKSTTDNIPASEDEHISDSEKESKLKKESSSPSTFSFTSDHPLHTSHATRCTTPEKAMIPNFLGSTLPRRDQGDREYYCATMLTFFVPWRSGRDLKKHDETWDDTFVHYKFSRRQNEIMDNMNLRYECLDSRDDFHAQMRRGTGMSTSWDRDSCEELNQSQELLQQNDTTIQDDPEVSDVVGSKEKRRREALAVMTGIMQRLGWENPANNSQISRHASNRVEVFQASSVWKSIIARMRREILDKRVQNMTQAQCQDPTMQSSSKTSSNVKIVDKRYFERGCRPTEWVNEIDNVVNDFTLNTEQERALRIVSNHVALRETQQLKMYIGGMGGTGKSQVLKGIMKFFDKRGESHRFIVVAPTGNAAALLGGSTYHHMFGINEQQGSSNSQLPFLKDKLLGVDYIFLDEVSMLSCRDLFRISERLSLITGNDDVFGGINMLFAGDFAQLPPAIGDENASLYSHVIGTRGTTLHDQESALGKTYWHQINTVVILRQNMRQREQTVDDGKFRLALENMRYKACTPADITFLRTRISSSIPGRPCILDVNFRNVPIITALNVHKDAINTLGCRRFSIETGQPLTHFYSEDTLHYKDDMKKKRKNLTVKQRPSLTDRIQSLLWDMPHCSSSGNLPGKLSLCVGMPVMIRYNGATELCITKGQEATVYGWQTENGSRNQLMLETLFVKLVNPPRAVKIDNLPENVVPLTRNSNQTVCSLPDDTGISILRSQVEVLPNFAMTDYASQGKTRKFNVVDLNNSRSHHAYYTALSRSASAAGSVILQGFDCNKITGGASGALRQEFRALELLDHITLLRYTGKLPAHVAGETRNNVIGSFRKWKGDSFVPPGIHKSIRWNKSDPYIEVNTIEIDNEKVASARRKRQERMKKSSTDKRDDEIGDGAIEAMFSPLGENTNVRQDLVGPVRKKRRNNADKESELSHCRPRKKARTAKSTGLETTAKNTIVAQLEKPLGLMWKENSCAYDATMSVLYNAWREDPTTMSNHFSATKLDTVFGLNDRFRKVSEGETDFDHVRDLLRGQLAAEWPQEFVWGAQIPIDPLLSKLLEPSMAILRGNFACERGHSVNTTRALQMPDICVWVNPMCKDIQEFVDDDMAREANLLLCQFCRGAVYRRYFFSEPPRLLSFLLEGSNVKPNNMLDISTHEGDYAYCLKGIIYYFEHHFTSRVFCKTGKVWFHDGLNPEMEYDGRIPTISDLRVRGHSKASAAIYVISERPESL